MWTGRYTALPKVEIRSSCFIQWVLLNHDDTWWVGRRVYMEDTCTGVPCRYDHDVPMNVFIPEPLCFFCLSSWLFRCSHMSGRVVFPFNRFIAIHSRVDILFIPHRHSIQLWRHSSYRSVVFYSLQTRMRLHHTRVIGHRISLVDLIPDGVSASPFYVIQ